MSTAKDIAINPRLKPVRYTIFPLGENMHLDGPTLACCGKKTERSCAIQHVKMRLDDAEMNEYEANAMRHERGHLVVWRNRSWLLGVYRKSARSL